MNVVLHSMCAHTKNSSNVAFKISLVFGRRQTNRMYLVVELNRTVRQFHQADIIVVALPNEFGMRQYLQNLVLPAHQIAGRLAGIVHNSGNIVGAQSNGEMGRRITVTSWIA